MTLYEINSNLQMLYDSMVDPETGEIDESILEQVTELEISRNEKIDNTACYIKSLESDADGISREIEKLKKRKETSMKTAERLREYLGRELAGEKFSSPRCVISYRKSSKVILDDIGSVPEEYLRRTESVELNKELAKKAFKRGEYLEGCHLEETTSMTIK